MNPSPGLQYVAGAADVLAAFSALIDAAEHSIVLQMYLLARNGDQTTLLPRPGAQPHADLALGAGPRLAEPAQHAPGLVGAHREGIAVVEAQRDRHAQAQGLQRGLHGVARHRLRALEDLERDGAGVFGIEVDAAAPERLVDDGGVAQALLHVDRRMRLRRLGQHLRR